MLKEAVRHSTFTTLGSLSNAVIGLLFAGLTIRFLGDQRAGFLLLIQSIVSISATTGGFGLGTAAIRRVAMLEAQGKLPEVRSCLGVVLSVNLFVGIVVAISLPLVFPWIFQWSRTDVGFRADAFYAYVLLALTFLVQQISSAYAIVFPGMRRYDLVTVLGTVSGLLSGGGGLLVLSINPTMTALAAWSLTSSVLILAISILLASRLVQMIIIPTWNLSELCSMLRFGGWVYLGQVFSLLGGSLDKVLLTTFLGSGVLPYYAIGQRAVLQVHALLTSQSQYLFPMLAAKGDQMSSAVERVEDRLRWFVGFISATIYGGLAIMAYPLLAKLVGDGFARQALVLFVLACVQGFFVAQAIVPYFVSLGEGRAAPNTVLTVVNSALVFAMMLLLVPRLGVLGASLAQLWYVFFSFAFVYWVDRAGGRFTWSRMFRPWISPLIVAVICLVTTLGGWQVQHLNWLYFVLGMAGFCFALTAGILVEQLLYAEYRCLETLRDAVQIVTRRFVPGWLTAPKHGAE
jgi:O-antigen/teichoic acid export membrane protein